MNSSQPMRLTAFKDLTRLEQTFFGLPFVITGALLSMGVTAFRWQAFLSIIPCFLLARISGMAFNQLIDRHIDAQNPRTKNRALPSGRVSPRQARYVAWGTLILFILLSLRINLTTALLAPIAAALLFFYSYMKRIHATCHFVLGAVHFLGSTMAYTAVGNSISPAAICLGGAAACLIIGTDIAYAIQDYEFDSKYALFSFPSRLGIKNSLIISGAIHLICLFFLIATGLLAHLSLLYYGIIPTNGVVFFYFHFMLWKELKKNGHFREIETIFFVCNVIISCSVLFFMFMHYL